MACPGSAVILTALPSIEFSYLDVKREGRQFADHSSRDGNFMRPSIMLDNIMIHSVSFLTKCIRYRDGGSRCIMEAQGNGSQDMIDRKIP